MTETETTATNEAIPPVEPTPTSVSIPPPAGGARSEMVHCPSCGQAAMVTVNRRDSADFCPGCDFPLFWAQARVLRGDETESAAESLRRLPGTEGRTTIASLSCPHCAEHNTVTAVTCVRCGLPLHPVAPPPPAPEPVPEPLPEPEPEPEPVAWWLVAVTLVALVLILGWVVWTEYF